jgi:hypothetical protein
LFTLVSGELLCFSVLVVSVSWFFRRKFIGCFRRYSILYFMFLSSVMFVVYVTVFLGCVGLRQFLFWFFVVGGFITVEVMRRGGDVVVVAANVSGSFVWGFGGDVVMLLLWLSM